MSQRNIKRQEIVLQSEFLSKSILKQGKKQTRLKTEITATEPKRGKMKFYVDKLHKSCSENDCPFNYDTIGCRAISSSMSNEDYDRFFDSPEYDTLCKYLSQNKYSEYMGRYPRCPLYLLRLEKTSEEE